MVNYVICFCINAKTDQFVVCKALISTVEFEQFFLFGNFCGGFRCLGRKIGHLCGIIKQLILLCCVIVFYGLSLHCFALIASFFSTGI